MREGQIKVSVMVGDRKVTLEGPEDFVREEVRRLTGSLVKTPGDSRVQAEAQGEREFIAEKRPKGHLEAVAVLAYCLKQQGHEEFTEEDMRRAYLRAGVRPPKVVGQAIRDAKNKFDFVEPGNARGTYRLSHHGERTVLFDLPRSETPSR